jgi:hypothetical protein
METALTATTSDTMPAIAALVTWTSIGKPSVVCFFRWAREEIFSGGRAEFAPTVAGRVWLKSGLRLRASASRGFRLPTYTDLYYSDPANRGNPSLKPESGWDFEFGPQWNSGGTSPRN